MKKISALLISFPLAAASFSGICAAENKTNLFGYTDGAQVVSVNEVTGRIDSRTGVIYSQIVGDRQLTQLRMNLLIPRNNVKKPAIIYFPGGGFTTADHGKFSEMRFALAKAGFVVASAQYRTVPNLFPALIEDAKSAVRFLRANADRFGIDSDKIGVLGDSAGGYVVQMLGATNGETEFNQGDFLQQSSDVQAVVSLYGISDLLSIGEGYSDEIQKVHESPAVTEALLVNGAAFNTFPGMSISKNKEKAQFASPIYHIDGNEPPFLLMHGSADMLVSPQQSAHMFEALQNNGQTESEYILIEGADHAGIKWYQDAVINKITDFFLQKLGPIEKGSEEKRLDL